MPSPKFRVQHFVACLAAPWEGTPGSDTFRTLESVGYVYTIPPDAEFPVTISFWFYARFFWTGGRDGFRRFAVESHWLDAPGGPRLHSRWRVGRVRLSSGRPVTSTAWPFGKPEFPGAGQYEFRLVCRVRRVWGVELRQIATEFVRIERAR